MDCRGYPHGVPKRKTKSDRRQISGYDVELPDELFEPQRLRQAIHSPLWQPYRAQVAHRQAAPEGEKKE